MSVASLFSHQDKRSPAARKTDSTTLTLTLQKAQRTNGACTFVTLKNLINVCK